MEDNDEIYKEMKEFGIDKYDHSFWNIETVGLKRTTEHDENESSSTTSFEQKEKNETKPFVIHKDCSDGTVFHEYRLDFIQAINIADEVELNVIMKIAIDISVRESHIDRVVGGEIDRVLGELSVGFNEFCDTCAKLERWIKRKHEETKKNTKPKDKQKCALEILESQKCIEQKEHDDMLKVFGSDLLIDIKKTPEEIYEETKNIRRSVILCLLVHSEALQRLVCVGKFYAPSLGHKYKYVGIPKESLDEFISFMNQLKSAFMTQQTSSGNFVLCIKMMVVKNGVDGFVNNVLKVARKLETDRLSLNSIV